MRKRLIQEDSSDSIMAVGMDLFATLFAVFFILTIIAFLIQGGEKKTLTIITSLDDECSVVLTSSIRMVGSSHDKKTNLCYSNGGCQNNNFFPNLKSFSKIENNTAVHVAKYLLPSHINEVELSVGRITGQNCVDTLVGSVLMNLDGKNIVSETLPEFFNAPPFAINLNEY